MRLGALLDAASAQAIGFAWLREAVAPAGSYGQSRFSAIEPFTPGEEEAACSRAARIARIAAAFDAGRLQSVYELAARVPDAGAAVARASMGDLLDDASLFEVQRFFDACTRLDVLTADCADVPRTVNAAVVACAGALEAGRAGSSGFYLADGFDPSLGQARTALAHAQAEYDAAQGRARAAVAQALDREVSLPEFIVMRADLDGPLPPGVRVVRETPAYFLCELDADEAALGAMRRRDDAAANVARVEEAVRERLSATIRAHASALDDAMRAFGEADVLVAAARFASAHRCTVAQIVNDGPVVFEAGRYLPLALELERQGRAYTPIDLRLDGSAVVTGPNMGGKSACLRACGFIALCAAFGLPVPALRAQLPLFAEIGWLGIGADRDPEGSLLSSFAREVVRLRDLQAVAASPRLILLDEFARTTNPREGKALLVAVLEWLRAEHACALAATHLAGVAQAAGAQHYAVRGLRGIPQRPATEDLPLALETLAASMDYTLEEVGGDGARGADAIALASLLGIDARVIDAAYRALEQ
ncbi:MAG TPA: hypothetical protein VMD47_03340 [Candidatus Acidoferrales bacterium]|nr:hypothetical protein [Candidatus Acidoferrales bacterium]